MSPEAQRIAIAEACGWTGIAANPFAPNPPHCGFHLLSGRTAEANAGSRWGIPDYLGSLDAMHEAEKVLLADGPDSDLWLDYLANTVVCAPAGLSNHATAAERAEAFLRTIGKWEQSAHALTFSQARDILGQ